MCVRMCVREPRAPPRSLRLARSATFSQVLGQGFLRLNFVVVVIQSFTRSFPPFQWGAVKETQTREGVGLSWERELD